jgi:hypothetical protein
MFECVEATRFDRMMSNGRTRPMLLVCDGQEGEVELVAKFSEGCSVGGLIREAMTAMLALDLGLPVPPPYLVELSEDFIDTIPDSTVAALLRKGDRFGYGSRRLPDGYAAWIEPAARMSAELEQEALDIFALDCWLTNGDRHVKNHNLLTNGKGFAIFDHELALMTDLNLFWKEPWQVKALDGSRPPQEHVFFGHLRGRAAYPIDGVSARFAALTDERISEYAGALPPSWAAEAQTVATARTFIMSLRDNLAPAGTELKRALS